ncbi:MAG TPA: diguanylate cyclase [Candidatus Deferrimicrobiaceae bacterium]|nr:diguanylate cyclase [Candidatus Deferrimicrobiaceae bacterium]
MNSVTAMKTSYDYGLVDLSVVLAMFASYAALELAGRVASARGRVRALWLCCGAIVMGLGIWAMHYVGMLALNMPITVSYHLPTVTLSLLAAIAASAVALFVVSRAKISAWQEIAGSVVMGSGIAAMHYIGMAAMRCSAVIVYDPRIVALSIVLAIVVSLVALRSAFGVRDEKHVTRRKIVNTLVMGSAIPLMHYTGMWAASFRPSSIASDFAYSVGISTIGMLAISTSTLFLLAAAIALSSLDRFIDSQRFDLNTARERELYFHTIAEAVPEIIWTATPNGQDDYFNQRCFDFTGSTLEEMRGMGWKETVHPDDLGSCVSLWQNALRVGEPYEIEYRLRGKDGSFRWFLGRANPIRNPSGEIVKWFGTCTDIESQKQNQQNLEGQIKERTLQLAETNTRLQRELYFQTMEGIPEIVWTADPDGAIDFTNRKWLEYSGLAAEQSLGRGWVLAIHADDLAICIEKWESAVLAGNPYEAEYRMRDSQGSFRWFLVRANPIRNSDGEIIKWFGTCTDIESQKQNQQILEEQILERTAQLADANTRLQEEMLEKDFARNELDQQNERMMSELEKRSERATMLAKMGELLQSCISRDEVFAAALGYAPKIFPTARGAIALLDSSRSHAEVLGSWSECQLPMREFEPTECWALRTGHPHLVVAGDSTAPCAHAAGVKHSYLCIPILAQGETLGILHLQATDEVPQLNSAELSFKTTFAGQVGLSIANIRLREALRMQSVRDSLTGLYNRRYLEEVLDREIRRAGRAGQSMGILMLDLDHFKRFNDTYGHDAGDAVLRETAAFLLKNVRAEDFVCRYGGEEFVVILPTADVEGSRARGEKLRSKMRELSIMHQGKSLGMVTLSVGVAAFPAHGMSPKELMASADGALYEAKRGGRDQVAVALAKSVQQIALAAETQTASNWG